jgi:hypothetical protein
MYNIGIWLEWLGKVTQYLSQDCLCPWRDSNGAPPGYRAEVLPESASPPQGQATNWPGPVTPELQQSWRCVPQAAVKYVATVQ